MGWRFYAQRAGTGVWLDTNLSLDWSDLSWGLSQTCSGKARRLHALDPSGIASDGRPLFGKYDTLVYGEEDGDLSWFGVCSAATPGNAATELEFVGFMGWTANVPYTDVFSRWSVNAFDVARHIIKHAVGKSPSLPIEPTDNRSLFSVGDKEPPPKPRPPNRRKGQSKADWMASDRYKQYQKDLAQWEKDFGEHEKYEIAYWEAPYCGEEIDTLFGEIGAEWLELVGWRDRTAMTTRLVLHMADDIRRRRDDIVFESGVNLVGSLDTSDTAQDYANHVIGLGAGEGRKMRRVQVGEDDGRLYQGQYVEYKHIRNKSSLRAKVQSDYKRLSNTNPDVQQVQVRDHPGYSPLRTLFCGDEVRVVSRHTSPAVDLWATILEISRTPDSDSATITVEVAR